MTAQIHYIFTIRPRHGTRKWIYPVLSFKTLSSLNQLFTEGPDSRCNQKVLSWFFNNWLSDGNDLSTNENWFQWDAALLFITLVVFNIFRCGEKHLVGIDEDFKIIDSTVYVTIRTVWFEFAHYKIRIYPLYMFDIGSWSPWTIRRSTGPPI
jgi:hypothetical protein